jgi:hypothetical protein
MGGLINLLSGGSAEANAFLVDTRKLGINVYNLCESAPGAAGTTTFVGSATTSMIATADFWA